MDHYEGLGQKKGSLFSVRKYVVESLTQLYTGAARSGFATLQALTAFEK